MNLTINRQTLATLLQRVADVAKPKNSTEICRGVRLEAKDGKLVASGTDLDVYIETSVDAMVKDGGVAVANHAKLSAFVSCMAGGDVKLSVGKRGLSVESGSQKATVSLMDEKLWPQMAELKNGAAEFSVDAKTLGRAISSVKGSCSKSDDRKTLKGVCVEIDGAGFTAIAADGISMSIYSSPADRGFKPAKGAKVAILPPLLVAAFSHILSETSGAVALRTDGKLASLESEGFSARGRLFDDEYPRWRNVAAQLKSVDSHLDVARADVMDALRLVSNTTEEAVGGLFVKAKFSPAGIEFAGSADDSASSAFVGAEDGGGPGGAQTFLICPKRLMNLVSSTVSDTIRMRYNADEKRHPVVVECPTGYTGIVMPAAYTRTA